MHLRKITIKNFRLLKDVSLLLEEQTTVIVGRNNSGKTSLAEFFRRLLSEGKLAFKLEDFSLGVHESFWDAFVLSQLDKEEAQIREVLPVIEARLEIAYTEISGVISDFIIELDPECHDVVVVIQYQLGNGKVRAFLGDIAFLDGISESAKKERFFQTMKERIPRYFDSSVTSEAPNDAANQKTLDWARLRALLQSGFVTAQRGLDDTTHRETDVLGGILGILFSTAMSDAANPIDRNTARELDAAIQQLQGNINTNFAGQLDQLLPAFSLFGYPGLPDPKLRTETQLNTQGILDNNTRIRYAGINGVHLPETYNGLGARNLIYILLKLLEFYKTFTATQPMPGICIIFIEEPEAHLHPQMQEVFVGKLNEIASTFSNTYGGARWPVQFIVTTHSPHIANKARFDTMRYFLATIESPTTEIYKTKIKDLRKGLSDTPSDDRDFLFQYMTLTRCDLLFADKAILIEGTSERLLLPRMLEKADEVQADPSRKLTSQYLSIVEVGGAYAHLFFKLLEFLELRTLIITDLDSVDPGDHGKACKVSAGTRTSNACIKNWFDPNITPNDLINKPQASKINGIRCIAYQVPEAAGETCPCGRTFEDAFMLANQTMCGIHGNTADIIENATWEATQNIKKSEFALKHAIGTATWVVPRYIREGLVWLADYPQPNLAAPAANPAAAPLGEVVADEPGLPHD